MVVWHHARWKLPGLGVQFPSDAGALGVDLFFVISGFIMVLTTFGKDVTPANFMRRRLERIVPLYWLFTLSVAGLVAIWPNLMPSVRPTSETLIKSLLFIPHLSAGMPGEGWPIVVVGWTLNYEMFFYLLFALSLFAPRPFPTLIAVLALLVGIGFIHKFDGQVGNAYTNPRLLEFALGAAIGHVWARHPPTWQWLEWRSGLAKALGDASYSIYLSHLFTLAALSKVWLRFDPNPTPTRAVVFLPIAIAVSAAAGWLIFKYVETPIGRWFAMRRADPAIETLSKLSGRPGF